MMRATVRILTLLSLFVVLCVCVVSCTPKAVASERAAVPGSPLDAVGYGAPAFADGDRCWLVTDRLRDESWWLVRLDGEWVTLPLGQDGAE